MNFIEGLKESEFELPEGEKCRGLFFRGYHSTYYQDGKFERKEGIRLLKKMSCPGCKNCGYLLDDVQDFIYGGGLIFPEIKHGALYSIHYTNFSKDWESGIVDDYDLEIYEVKE